jgi:hypothetical protein
MSSRTEQLTLPNFLHVGVGKGGSTWLHEALSTHPDAFLSEAKDLYYFTRFYDRGPDWYAHQFAAAPPDARVIGEVCPEYLWHPDAPDRIRDSLPGVRVMATLRDPVTRAYSAYLYDSKNGMTQLSFREALDASPRIIDEARYRTHLERYLKALGPDALHVTVFDDLAADPQAFLDDTTDWLGLARHALPPELLAAQLPASRARSAFLARRVKGAAEWVRRRNGAELVGRIKRSRLVNRTLYEPLTAAPEIPAADADRIREQLTDEIEGVENLFGLSLRKEWGWP